MDSNNLELIKKVCSCSGRGIFKRIDENRELMELLQRELPAFLKTHPWIEGWLACQDIFLVDLTAALGWPMSMWLGRDDLPRAWPGRSNDPYYAKSIPANLESSSASDTGQITGKE